MLIQNQLAIKLNHWNRNKIGNRPPPSGGKSVTLSHRRCYNRQLLTRAMTVPSVVQGRDSFHAAVCKNSAPHVASSRAGRDWLPAGTYQPMNKDMT